MSLPGGMEYRDGLCYNQFSYTYNLPNHANTQEKTDPKRRKLERKRHRKRRLQIVRLMKISRGWKKD